MNTFQSFPTSHAERSCLVGRSSPWLGGPGDVCTPKTWLSGFLLANDTGGNDLIATETRWRWISSRKQALRFKYTYKSSFYQLPGVWTWWHLSLRGGWGFDSFNSWLSSLLYEPPPFWRGPLPPSHTLPFMALWATVIGRANLPSTPTQLKLWEVSNDFHHVFLAKGADCYQTNRCDS